MTDGWTLEDMFNNIWIVGAVVACVVVLALCCHFFSDYSCCSCTKKQSEQALPRTRQDVERQVGYRQSDRQDEEQPLEDQVYVFKYTNKTHSDLVREDRKGIPELDLHNLTVGEALHCTRNFIALYTPDLREHNSVRVVNIVTGRGVHSTDNIPRVKNAIIKELQSRNNIRFDECHKGGMLRLHISCASRGTFEPFPRVHTAVAMVS